MKHNSAQDIKKISSIDHVVALFFRNPYEDEKGDMQFHPHPFCATLCVNIGWFQKRMMMIRAECLQQPTTAQMVLDGNVWQRFVWYEARSGLPLNRLGVGDHFNDLVEAYLRDFINDHLARDRAHQMLHEDMQPWESIVNF